MRILEPSAGQGHIAEAFQKHMPNLQIDVVELRDVLQRSLQNRGFNLVHDDIMSYSPGPVYDRVVMNPPYGKGRSVIHTLQCFQMLKPGGKLISVIPRSDFNPHKDAINPVTGKSYSQQLLTKMREPGVEARTIQLPQGSFQNGDLPRTVDTTLLIMTKKA